MSAFHSHGDVVVILDAGTDAGYRQAHTLLDAGCRVAVTDRHVAKLARILHGYSASQVIAIAAEPEQLELLIDRVQQRFGHPVTRIVDAGAPVHSPVSTPVTMRASAKPLAA